MKLPIAEYAAASVFSSGRKTMRKCLVPGRWPKPEPCTTMTCFWPFGDRRWESPGCMLPWDTLGGVEDSIRPHHHYPRLRMELRTILTWREDVEVALERLLGSMTPSAPQLGVLRPV